MQLILKTDAEIGIRSNMSVLEQDSFSLNTKIAKNDVTDKIKSAIPSVTEINTNNKNDSTGNDVLGKDGNLVNGKVDEILNEISARSETDNELSNKSKVLSSKVEEVDKADESIDRNNENESNRNLQDNLNTSDNDKLNEEEEDQSSNKIETDDMVIINDKEENVCEEIETDLRKSENMTRDPNETRESNLNVVLENVSCKELSFPSHKDTKQLEMKKKLDSEISHELELPTERKEEKNKSDKKAVTETEFTMRVKNVNEINEKVLETCTDTNLEDSEVNSISLNKIENPTNSPVPNEILSSYNDKIFDFVKEIDVKSNQKSSNCEKNDEVIDIGDDKDDECGEKESEELQKILTSENSSSNEKIIKSDIRSTKEETARLENIDNELLKSDDESNLAQEKNKLDDEIIKEIITETSPSTNTIKEKKRLLHISKLSNTLDILSDDDENDQVPKAVPENKEPNEKQCISIEDDDDIMLIDEETSDDTDNTGKLLLPEPAMELNEETKDQTTENDIDVTMDVDESSEDLPPKFTDDHENVKESKEELKDKLQENIEHTEEKSSSPKPLLPVNFLKSCKKNFAEMTREELEEFCVLKIVESVVDRSNLSEMNLQIKAMSQNIDDYKKKTNTLLKQNRDLQVVLKSIQEEQKKNCGQAITPLKITRSVGMQVLMIETQMARKRTVPCNKFPTNSLNPAKLKNQSPKTLKGPTNTQQIPVPRLVPAVNSTNNKQQASSPVATKAQGVPNGLRSSPPTTKPEKRSFNKMQQGNSITVDLTDDEPPSKVVPRNVAPPVRLVPQQSLLTSQRPQFLNTVNIPRKVYIPISGSQNPVSPGQTIMLKQVSPHVPRLRGPGVVQKSCNSVRMPRIAPKHPAPLPDSMKQYQPPNWKALPPPPELKLSKVENGIVISWKIDGYQEENHEEIASYQLYAYQETSSPPSTSLWKKIGDVKALPLPMACTLTQFMAGYKYYFAVRAVDVRSRLGPFSLPGNILLLNKM